MGASSHWTHRPTAQRTSPLSGRQSGRRPEALQSIQDVLYHLNKSERGFSSSRGPKTTELRMMYRLPVAGELRNAVVLQGDASREVTVIGAGIVGVCCALYLQREGFAVTVVDREAPGEGCSKGNAGIFGAASCVPLAMPGAARRMPRTLLSSCSSPSVRLHHLPKAAPWLLRFLLGSRRRRMGAIARALRSLQRSLFDAYAPLLEDAGAEAMVQRSGKLLSVRRQNLSVPHYHRKANHRHPLVRTTLFRSDAQAQGLT